MAEKVALFLHVLSIATWFGGLSVMAVWLRKSIAFNDSGIAMDKSLESVHNLNVRMMVPVAVLALAAGFYLLMSMYGGADKQLWLLIKERFGSLFILLYIIGFPIYGGKLLKKAKAADVSAKTAIVKRYIHTLNFSLLLILVLILAVTFKFA
ncbi:hypothetical protein GXN76_14060 [Kroppenstedtia pulmonis]|uniref:DUF2269 family protein n=1 Tax=Kroppenstedtia pulmonis TaxID=1380685 RepID=A0A7D4B3M0_9BACL|nr:hypothetical protein [Kroppenstedtia pulmonis]QKG85466.1 hypothetical protein GXN76_14060 [Kroppenstedtia pulmonis]